MEIFSHGWVMNIAIFDINCVPVDAFVWRPTCLPCIENGRALFLYIWFLYIRLLLRYSVPILTQPNHGPVFVPVTNVATSKLKRGRSAKGRWARRQRNTLPAVSPFWMARSNIIQGDTFVLPSLISKLDAIKSPSPFFLRSCTFKQWHSCCRLLGPRLPCCRLRNCY